SEQGVETGISSTLSDRKRECLGGGWSEPRFQAGARAEFPAVSGVCGPSNAEANDNTDRKMRRRRTGKRESHGNPPAEPATGGACESRVARSCSWRCFP